MMADRWDKLDALAAAATPGPWAHADESGERPGAIWRPQPGHSPNIAIALTNADAAFIAACDPATIRSLVAAVRERDELRVALEIIAADRPDWTPESISIKARNIARAAPNLPPSTPRTVHRERAGVRRMLRPATRERLHLPVSSRRGVCPCPVPPLPRRSL